MHWTWNHRSLEEIDMTFTPHDGFISASAGGNFHTQTRAPGFSDMCRRKWKEKAIDEMEELKKM